MNSYDSNNSVSKLSTKLSSFNDFIKVKKLAETHETPFYALNLSRIRENARRFTTAVPNSKVFYAIKANSDSMILKELYSEGVFFDVASSGEIEQCKSLGISSEHMIFSNPIKKHTEIKNAFEKGIRFFAFDNYFELEKLALHAPGSNVYLRLCVYGANSKQNLNEKFGAMQEEAVDLMLEAAKKGLKPVGIAFHVGSQCSSAKDYTLALIQTSEIMKELLKRGINLEFVNVGGGFPVNYTNETYDLNEYFREIRETTAKFLPGTQIFMEPGRAMVGDSTSIVFSVIGKNSRAGKTWYYVDESVYSSFLDCLSMDQKFSYYAIKKGKTESAVIAGRTCASEDVIAKDIKLPKLEIGDKIIVKNAGAYTKTFNTNFNSFEDVKTIYFTD